MDPDPTVADRSGFRRWLPAGDEVDDGGGSGSDGAGAAVALERIGGTGERGVSRRGPHWPWSFPERSQMAAGVPRGGGDGAPTGNTATGGGDGWLGFRKGGDGRRGPLYMHRRRGSGPWLRCLRQRHGRRVARASRVRHAGVSAGAHVSATVREGERARAGLLGLLLTGLAQMAFLFFFFCFVLFFFCAEFLSFFYHTQTFISFDFENQICSNQLH